jgi:hypothetical protein
VIAIRPLPIEVKVICSSVSIRLKQYKTTITITITEIMANLPQTELVGAEVDISDKVVVQL